MIRLAIAVDKKGLSVKRIKEWDQQFINDEGTTKMKKNFIILLLVGIIFLLSGCSSNETLTIISGSENETLEPILKDFERETGIHVEMQYKGSVDMMMEMQTDAINQYDAVWPANSLWISIGDTSHKIEHASSIMTSPIVFGVRKSLAEALNLVDKDVSIHDLLELIEGDKLRFMMTSATQSNSGACAYIGFLNALLGNPDTISLKDLENEQLKRDVTSLLSGINRSSGSSGWLKQLFLEGDYDAMVNYEALVIEANQELVNSGKEPLYAIYPYDGLAVADSPLGYVNNGDADKEEAFLELQAYLLSDKVQAEILALGRRTGFGGTVSEADERVFNPEWGIDANKTISGIRMPDAEVISQALLMYQTEFKKPSLTVYCLDYSGSMQGEGETSLKEAMRLILDQETASQYLLQSTPKDMTIVVPFNQENIDVWVVEGNNSSEMNELIGKIDHLDPGGGTDIYTAAMYAIDFIQSLDYEAYIPAVVLMTDGKSNDGRSFRDFEAYYEEKAMDVPVFSILFGKASEDQLKEIEQLTRSRIFDGKDDLISAFKKARGYN
ncbi:MAG: Ca-activated chloride channel [Clostridiales bacterium]|jgi:Ca-activated chloride channel family protein|nr:Ca-activated chloride channel [Clostridiales bacterium]MDN5300472.1 Ca-activated chloride channel [Clostridiales bacterium]